MIHYAGIPTPCGRKGRVRMKWIIWTLAVVSTTALIVLWFWEVRRKLREQYSMVESARSQLAAYEKRAAVAAADADVAEICRRSASIYRQAADNYNATLYRPLMYFPGYCMGFRPEEP